MNTLAVWLVCEFTRCTVGACALWFMWSWCDNCYRQDEQDINNTIYELFKFFQYYGRKVTVHWSDFQEMYPCRTSKEISALIRLMIKNGYVKPVNNGLITWVRMTPKLLKIFSKNAQKYIDKMCGL